MGLLGRYITILSFVVLALASSGDRAPEFQNCISACYSSRCLSPTSLPFFLQLTRWTCTDDCKYTCMHHITDKAIQYGHTVQQYHGKWPFWRFMGMQEPASVAFSLLNLWTHVYGARQVRQNIPSAHPMKSYYLTWAVVSINAWIWSAVFHTRDLPWTEKMDYFSAALAILYALYYTVVRLFHLYPLRRQRIVALPSDNHWRKPAYIGWSSICIFVYLAHITYLSLLDRFDYAYNMAFNVGLGMTHNLLWLSYSLPPSFSILRRFPHSLKSYKPPYAGDAALFVVLTTAATTLELADFPPLWRVIDAHSLWHLATGPITVVWYAFLVKDALDNGWREMKR
ncbi:Per1-like protein [Hygrophoropsis aurantiaca]|uniref:Per1-like protein n=1 Tax=Hygrophoropsis aurantiaca TaxID=72124 RepID=A0ACB8AEF6_9AGAM|nr:Per1-like protein [Hygrophoropsis aurantiaca]